MNRIVACLIIVSSIMASGAISASEELAKSKNCLSCHGVDSRLVGPGFKEVAQKYSGQPDAAAKLAEKVIKGGGGVWGNMPMPPNSKVSPDEANKLVQWVLSLK